MKKLTNKQVSKALNVVARKDGGINKTNGWISLARAATLLSGGTLHFRTPGSRGKRSGIDGSADNARQIVEAMGYDVDVKNDAPRGGEMGDYYVKAGRKIEFQSRDLLDALGITERPDSEYLCKVFGFED